MDDGAGRDDVAGEDAKFILPLRPVADVDEGPAMPDLPRPQDPAGRETAQQETAQGNTAAQYAVIQGRDVTPGSEWAAADHGAGWDDSWNASWAAAREAGWGPEAFDTDWTMPVLSEDEQRFNEEAMAVAIALLAQEFNLVR